MNPLYVSRLRFFQKSARDIKALFTQQCPDICAKIAQQPRASLDDLVIPTLRLPFPEDLTSLIISISLPNPIAQRLSDRVYEWYRSITALQSKKFQQSCYDLLSSMPEDSKKLATTIDKLCRAYEALFLEHHIPVIRSEILSMKSRFSALRPPQKKVPFNSQCTPLLEQYFDRNAYPSASDRLALARKTNMSPRQIEVWFQNHRRRAKQEGRSLKRWMSHQHPPGSPFEVSIAVLDEGLQCTNDHDSSGYESSGDDQPVFSTYSPPTVCTLDHPRPLHAFPTVYPLSGIDKGVFKFSAPLWERKPATALAPLPVINVDELTALFASKLNLREGLAKTRTSKFDKAVSSGPKWFSSRITIPAPAPHPALLPLAPLQMSSSIFTSRTCGSLSSTPLPSTLSSRSRSPSSHLSSQFLNMASLPLRRPTKPIPYRGPPPFPSTVQTFGSRVPSLDTAGTPRSRLSSSSSSLSSIGPGTPPLSPTIPIDGMIFTESDFQILDELFGNPMNDSITKIPPAMLYTESSLFHPIQA